MLLGPGPESAPRSAFWAILGTCLGVPQRMLFECFLAFLGPKNAKKHSKSTLWGTPRQVPKIAQNALRGALSGPGPKSTPVNGGRDRNPRTSNFMGMGGFPAEKATACQAPIKLAQPFPAPESQRALRSKKFNPDRVSENFNPGLNFRPRSKISISIEIFSPAVFLFTGPS